MSVIRFTYEGRGYDRRVTGMSDVEFWVEERRAAGGPALEPGCGTGRVTTPVAKVGLDVTGLDNSESMLRCARRKSAAENVEVRWVDGGKRFSDPGGFGGLDREYALIYVPLASFAHLGAAGDAEACPARASEHLAPRGRFEIDLMSPEFTGALAPSSNPQALARPDIVTGGPGLKTHTLDEIKRLFTSTGFQIIDTFGCYDRSPVGAHSPRLLIMVERKCRNED